MSTLRAVTTILAMATLGHAAFAHEPPSKNAMHEGRAAAPSDALRAIPDDADVVVACRNLAEFRSTSAGAFVLDLFATEAFASVREGWTDLARTVELSPAEAFDAILGERVVIAVRRGDEALPDWTVQAAVSGKTEQRLRKRLRVAPRTIIDGQTLYSVERGALELSVVRSADRSAPARVVLGPSGSRLFEDIIRADRKNADPLLRTPLGASIARLPQGDVLILARLREQENAWAAMSGAMRADSFSASVIGVLPLRDGDRANRATWNEASARTLGDDTLAAIFDSPTSAFTVVGEAIGGAVFADLKEIFEHDMTILGREAVLLEPGTNGVPVITSAVELHDIERGAAMGDRAMDLMLESFEMTPRGFDGMVPTAVRRVEEGAIALAWVFEPIADRDADREAQAWWIYTTDPSRIDAVRARFASMNPGGDGGVRTYAHISPSALLAALPLAPEALPDLLRSLKGIESVEWVEQDAAPGALDASLRVRFVQPDAAR